MKMEIWSSLDHGTPNLLGRIHVLQYKVNIINFKCKVNIINYKCKVNIINFKCKVDIINFIVTRCQPLINHNDRYRMIGNGRMMSAFSLFSV